MSRLHDGAERGFKLDDIAGSLRSSRALVTAGNWRRCVLLAAWPTAMDLLPCVSVCEVSHTCFSNQPSALSPAIVQSLVESLFDISVFIYTERDLSHHTN
jgi:hypothetical protein